MKAAARTIRGTSKGALRTVGEGIMRRSKAEFVPVRTGMLKSTGRVEEPRWRGDVVTCQLKYGGPDAPYAKDVHERANVYHPVGQFKYLQAPLYEAAGSFASWVASVMRF